ncbi:protein-disulfide reductase DsbD domain-containing protein [Pseudomonas aeruginosa]|uniref:cytochrome c biogenesis protein CcdA n=1 Tax=Pseudomonas aeruginosa TaxID=287 RepID=UPI000FF79496|nr:protein-disulfide reductase DsbD domain-containing protein [Pseudomonas aeruginosa]RWX77734.1 hypothetical protein EQH81_26050 [Pseudomonas aeruginosa]
MRVLILLLMLLLPGLSQAQPGDDLFAPRGATQTDFLPVEKAFRFTWERLDDGQVQLRWQIAPGYYLYQKRLRFDGLDPALQPQLPPGESHSDEFFGESQVYRQSLELTLPAALRDRLDGLSRGRKGGSLAGAAALGALSGLLVGPCMTAPLAGALLYIAQTGNALHGGLVLFSLGLGIGMPLLLLVTVGSRFLPKPGPWMNLVKGVFGFLFLGTAWILLRPLLGEALWIGLGGALLLVLAYAALHTARGLARHAVLFGAAGCIFGLWGAAMLLGAAAGADDPWRPLQVYAAANRGATPTASAHEAFLTVSQPAELDRQLAAAKAEGQWVLLDYYADWCVSCRIMEKQVFAKPDVLAALQGVRLLRLDVTADNAASRELLRRYQVPGPPSLIWIGPEGEERRARRLTGEVDAGGFLAHWQATRERG